MRNSKGQFVKGLIPWNKGMIGYGNRVGFRVHGKTANTGRTRFKKGCTPWNYGKGTLSICRYCRKKFYRHGIKRPKIFCSKRCQGLGKRGKDHFAWKGGVSKEREKEHNRFEYKKWRKEVFSKDNYTCKLCGKRGCYLEAHHIKRWSEFPRLRYEVSNGKTLCRECHKIVTFGKVCVAV